jgi:hypothetical protein
MISENAKQALRAIKSVDSLYERISDDVINLGYCMNGFYQQKDVRAKRYGDNVYAIHMALQKFYEDLRNDLAGEFNFIKKKIETPTSKPVKQDKPVGDLGLFSHQLVQVERIKTSKTSIRGNETPCQEKKPDRGHW